MRALDEVREKNTQLEESLKRVEEMAATDPLTGLYNRRHFGRVIDQLFAEAYRFEQDLACVMIDMDGFKQLNDGFGHQVGDSLLMAAGKAIQANLRSMDIAARYGGDEFVLLIPHAGLDQASLVADRIRAEFKQASSALLKRPAGVSMSIGVSTIKHNRPAGGLINWSRRSGSGGCIAPKEQGRRSHRIGRHLPHARCLHRNRLYALTNAQTKRKRIKQKKAWSAQPTTPVRLSALVRRRSECFPSART